jgi:hypothetical protein
MTTPSTPYAPEVYTALARGDAGDVSALAEVRQALDDHPELVAQLGDLAANAETAVLGLLAGTSLTAREAARRSLDSLRQELLGPSPSTLERLLVERVVIANAWVHFSDLDLANRLALESESSPACRAAAKRLDQAQRRYLSAVKALALVRKLLPRSVLPVKLLTATVNEGPGEVPAAIKKRRAIMAVCGETRT